MAAPRGRWELLSVSALAALAMSACAAGPMTSAVSPSAATAGPAAADCAALDLRSPTGERIALSGTWVTEREGTRAGIYYLHQVGECLWFAGSFPPPGDNDAQGLLGFQTVVFKGRVRSDFSITGEWIDVRHVGLGPFGAGGTMTLQIEFSGPNDAMRLVFVGGSGQTFVEPGYREEQSWIKISEGGAYPPPSPEP